MTKVKLNRKPTKADVGKTVAIDAGKKLVEKAQKSYPHQNHKSVMFWFHQKKLLKK